MMNIRDYFLINKTKSSNKIKILDLLGFESDTLIENSSYESTISEERMKEVFHGLNAELIKFEEIGDYDQKI